MLRVKSVCLILIMMFSLAMVSAAAGDIVQTVRFDRGELDFEIRDGYNVVRVEGCLFEQVPGMPMIPYRTMHFSIPAGMEVAEVEIRSIEQSDLGDGFRIYPAQPAVRLSDETPPAFVEPDETVYRSAVAYPDRAAAQADNGNMGGYAIASVRVYPLEYIPADGRLLLNESVEISLRLAVSETGAKAFSGRSERAEEAIARRVRSLVVNPENVEENIGPRQAGKRSDTVEYAIITKPVWVDEFQPLADWKTKKGIPTEVFDTEWIYGTYSGVDNQEQIRNFIKDYETNHGLVYVLLGSDHPRMNSRVLWDDVSSDMIIGDLYFSDTDGDWNADGDDHYGEHPEDNVDMYGDVYVGRAPIHDPDDAIVFVNKILTYEGADAGDPLPLDFQDDMLFLAEILWDSPYTNAGVLKDMIDSDDVPSLFNPITKLYEHNGNLNYTSAMAAMNAGPNITNHAGHCNTSTMSIGPNALHNADMDALVNGTRQGIFYTIGCWPAAFDGDCIAEHYVNNPDGGGVAYVGNSRSGWGWPGNPGYGASELYDREFFHVLFTEDTYNLGITHADHKDAFVSDAKGSAYMRYCLYELNLLGDPEMPVWTDTPASLVVSHPSALSTGGVPFAVSVNDAKAPVQGALVCLMKGDEVYEVGTTDGSGQVTLYPDAETGGAMYVTVTGHNFLPYEGEALVEENTVDPDLSDVVVNDHLMLLPDGGGDSTMTIVVTVRNGSGDPMVGIPAGDVSVVLRGVSSLGEGMHFCESGEDTLFLLSAEATDASGEVGFTVNEMGGCGAVTIEAAAQGVTITGTAVSNVRSPDITGDGVVNFLDTFYYISMLNAATGYCGNFDGSADGVVNFLDTSKYLPALAGAVKCP